MTVDEGELVDVDRLTRWMDDNGLPGTDGVLDLARGASELAWTTAPA